MAPTTSESCVGDTVRDATGAITVTDAVAESVPVVAVTVVAPTATPVTLPLVCTVAIAGSAVDHATGKVDNTFPAASFTVAESRPWLPTGTVRLEALSAMDTGTGARAVTVTETVPVTLPDC